eukprot:9063128-Ditylum_brightwellii.AAC.1
MEVPTFVAQKHSAAKIKHTSQKKQPIPNQKNSWNFLSSPIKDPTLPPLQFTPDKTIQNEGKKISPPPNNKNKSHIVPPSTTGRQGNGAGRLSGKGGQGWIQGGPSNAHGAPGRGHPVRGLRTSLSKKTMVNQ